MLRKRLKRTARFATQNRNLKRFQAPFPTLLVYHKSLAFGGEVAFSCIAGRANAGRSFRHAYWATPSFSQSFCFSVVTRSARFLETAV